MSDTENHVDGISYCNICNYGITNGDCNCTWRSVIKALEKQNEELRIMLNSSEMSEDEAKNYAKLMKDENNNLIMALNETKKILVCIGKEKHNNKELYDWYCKNTETPKAYPN